MNSLLKLMAWLKAEQEEEQRANIAMLCFLVLFAPIWLVTSLFVLDERRSVLVAAAVTLPIFLGGYYYLRRVAAQPESDVPSPRPLSELSRYQLYVEREKAVRIGDTSRVSAVDAEVSIRR
jgi:hypothetical protein